MVVSRRNLFRTLGMSAVAGAAVHWPLGGNSRAAVFEPTRTQEPGGPILLNLNESPYGPSPKVIAVMQSAMATVNRYPYLQYDGLVEQVASHHGVKPEQVLLGCGSGEILQASTTAFLGNGRRLVQASPTFEGLERHARVIGAEVVSIPLTQEWAHDLDSMLRQANASTGLVYICNPNNPTGSITPRKDLETFISKLPGTCYVLIDEAYCHYAKQSPMYSSFIENPIDDKRVIVCRTFSGVYGLAGLRLGYGIASPGLIERLRVHTTFDSVNGSVVRVGAAALEDTASVRDCVEKNAFERQEFFNQAMARVLKPPMIDSHANFVMVNAHHPAAEVIEHFRKNNILIGRRFPPLDTHVRISLGTSEEMRAFWRTWDTLPYPKQSHH